jgi:hypothetical protein
LTSHNYICSIWMRLSETIVAGINLAVMAKKRLGDSGDDESGRIGQMEVVGHEMSASLRVMN